MTLIPLRHINRYGTIIQSSTTDNGLLEASNNKIRYVLEAAKSNNFEITIDQLSQAAWYEFQTRDGYISYVVDACDDVIVDIVQKVHLEGI